MTNSETTLFFWPTPNSYKISNLLEELEIKYHIHSIDIGKGKQFTPEFLAISPYGKVPAIQDHSAPNTVKSYFETGAILLYLADDDHSIADIAVHH